MKKFFCALLAAVMMSSFTACSILENNPISNLLERFTSSEEETDVPEDEDDSYTDDVSVEEEALEEEDSDILEVPDEPEEEPSTEDDSDDSLTTQVQPEVESQVEVQTETSTTTATKILPDGVSASSVLDSQSGHNYWVSNTLDDTVTTAWIEAADGIGVGEYITFYFDDGAAIQEIELYNGYGGSYDNNGVIDVIEISIDTGGSMVYELDDYWNTIVFAQPVTTTTITLTILEAHSSDWEDTGISEIRFYDYSDKDVTENIG